MNNDKIVYNKLVRDLIPEVIKATNKKFSIHIADEDEYRIRLQEKLKEEVDEFIENPSSEEMADILEVIDALIKLYNFDDIKAIKNSKNKSKGKFNKRIILESVDK